MGLVTGILTLPLAPVKGVVWLGERVLEQAERQSRDQSRVIRQLEDLADAVAAGEISEADAEHAEAALIAELTSDDGRLT